MLDQERSDFRFRSGYRIMYRVTTHLENLEKSGNWKVVREKSGKQGKVRESYNHHLAGA